MVKTKYGLTWGNPEKPAVLLLHGFMGSAVDWSEVAGYARNQYFLIAADLPGHASAGKTKPGFDAARSLILDILDNYDLPHIALCGYSLGGRVALDFALHYPAYVSAIILESTSPGMPEGPHKQARLEQDKSRAAAIRADYALFLNAWYDADLFMGIKSAPHFRQLLQSRLAQDKENIAQAIVAYSPGVQTNYRVLLPAFKKPTLLIHGEDDVRYRQITHEMLQLNMSFKSIAMKNCSHNTHFMQPQLFAEHLVSFLNLSIR